MAWRAPTLRTGQSIRASAPQEHWRSAVEEILARAGLPCEEPTPFASGSDVVWGAGDSVVKLTTPRWRTQMEWEVRVLQHVQGSLPVATPNWLGQGELDGWPYLVMQRVPGIAIGTVWPQLSVDERSDLAREIGAVTRALHDLPAPSGAEPWGPFWRRCQAQAPAALDRGLRHPLADRVEAFLAEVGPLAEGPPALLHTELLDQHLLVERRPAPGAPGTRDDDSRTAWRLSALIDFADARVGAAPYDLPALAEFLFRDQPQHWDPFFAGYAWAERQGSRPTPLACLAWGLQHQFTSLTRAVEAAGDPEPNSLEELAQRLYGPTM